jgi:hypothetical protein
MTIDSNTAVSVKVRAAEAIFNHAAKAIEIDDIEARVAVLGSSGSECTATTMKIIDGRLRKLEDRFWACGRQEPMVIPITHEAWEQLD